MRICNIRDTYGGTAWSLDPSPRSPLLAVGCEDGVVRLFRYDSSGSSSGSNGVRGSSSGYGSASSDNIASYLAGNDSSSGSGSSNNSTNNQLVLEYSKSMPTSGSRVLCLSHHPTERTLFAGCSDGSVRCMEEETGRVLFRMLGDVLRGSVSTLIWSVLVLADSTVITGDSRGQVSIL